MTLAILCPGQGGQHPAMLDILRDVPAAEAVLAAARPILRTDPRDLAAASQDLMFSNIVAQPLVCAVTLATWAALRDRLPPPCAIAGYSVGELAAYGCADALTADEVIALARRRAEAMDTAAPEGTGLLAVRRLGRDPVAALCRSCGTEIAIVNGADRFVIGGAVAALAAFGQAVAAKGGAITPLPVPVASHTAAMMPAAPRFRDMLLASGLRAPSVPVLAGVDGAPVFDRRRAIATLSAQLTRTVDWAACLDGLVERRCRVVLELGPGGALAMMARDRLSHIAVRSVSDFRSLEGVIAWVRRETTSVQRPDRWWSEG